jgi:hypothetical protein
MNYHCTGASQNAITITVNLLAPVIMIAALTLVPGHASAWITGAGVLLLAVSGLHSGRLGRVPRRARR